MMEDYAKDGGQEVIRLFYYNLLYTGITLIILVTMVYFVSAAGCHCFDLWSQEFY